MIWCYAAAQVHFERTDRGPIGAGPYIVPGVHSKGPDNLFVISMLDIPALTDNIFVHERYQEAEWGDIAQEINGRVEKLNQQIRLPISRAILRLIIVPNPAIAACTTVPKVAPNKAIPVALKTDIRATGEREEGERVELVEFAAIVETQAGVVLLVGVVFARINLISIVRESGDPVAGYHIHRQWVYIPAVLQLFHVFQAAQFWYVGCDW